MKKNIVMSLERSKETKGCYRYGHSTGDKGVTTIYMRKEDVEGTPPETITVSIRG